MKVQNAYEDIISSEQEYVTFIRERMLKEAERTKHQIYIEETVCVSAEEAILVNVPIKGCEEVVAGDMSNGLDIMFIYIAARISTFHGLHREKIPSGFYVVRIADNLDRGQAQLVTPEGDLVGNVKATIESSISGHIVPQLRASGTRRGSCFTADVSGLRINFPIIGWITISVNVTVCL